MKRMVASELRKLEISWIRNDIAKAITILTASKSILENHSDLSLLGLPTTYINSR